MLLLLLLLVLPVLGGGVRSVSVCLCRRGGLRGAGLGGAGGGVVGVLAGGGVNRVVRLGGVVVGGWGCLGWWGWVGVGVVFGRWVGVLGGGLGCWVL